MKLVLNTLLARLCFVCNIIVFNKHLGAKNVTKQDYDKIKASTPHYDKYMLFKLLIIHILRIFYNYCYLWQSSYAINIFHIILSITVLQHLSDY